MSDPLSATSNTFPEQPSPVRPSVVEKSNVQRLEEVASELVTDETPESTPTHTNTRNSAVYQEPAVPDPFLVDDEHDDDEDEEESEDEDDGEGSRGGGSEHDSPPAVPSKEDTFPPELEGNAAVPVQPVDLASPSSIPVSIPVSLSNSTSPGLKKEELPPPPPVSDTEDEEEEAPEIYAPDLIRSTMFLPIPNTDPLTTMLNKFIPRVDDRPARDLTGDWQRADFNALVMSNSWRALARMARDRIVTSDGEDIALVLGLWSLRLASLARMRLFNQTAAECTNLFSVLYSIEPPSARDFLFERILPFELEVMHARLKYWAGEHMAYLDLLVDLLKKCRIKARGERDPGLVEMWQERGARLCLIIASQLVEMKDTAGAINLLEPLCRPSRSGSPPSAELRSAIGRLYLQAGHMQGASQHFSAVAEDPEADPALKDMNAALYASADGQWDKANDLLRGLVVKDETHFTAVNNLAVALLGQGKLQEGIDVLETALQASPSTLVVAEPFLFNLSTLYELRSSSSLDQKRALLIKVAQWSGDGLRTTALKMPTS